MYEGNYIEAIKLLNEHTSLWLKWSKDIVDQMRWVNHPLKDQQPYTTYSEKVQTSDMLWKLTVTYFDNEWKKHNIMPTDTELRAKAKKLAGPNNSVIQKYEDIYRDIKNKIDPDTNESQTLLWEQNSSWKFSNTMMGKLAIFMILVSIIFMLIHYYKLFW